MRRFVGSLVKDAVLQFRGGFYYVGALVAVIYVVLLSRVPADWPLDLPLILPAVLVINLMVTTFYFVAGMVLLERDEGTLEALATSPLRVGEYLAAKTVSLAFLAIAENVAVLLAFYGTGFEPVSLMTGLLMMCAFYTLIGVITISYYDSINSFLIPSGFAIMVLVAPPVVLHFSRDAHWWVYLHPVQPYLSLVKAAFSPATAVQLVYGVLAGCLWLALAYIGARRAYLRMALR
jgi:fluoroquinolone transport system permease protein